MEKSKVSYLIMMTMKEKDKYANEIISEISKITNGVIQLKTSTLYSTLSKLEKTGIISSYWDSNENGGKCHYYNLTNLGKKELESFDDKELEEIINQKPTSLEENKTEEILSKNSNDQILDEKKENALKQTSEEPKITIPQQIDLFEEKKDEIYQPSFNIEDEFLNIETTSQSFSKSNKKTKTSKTLINKTDINNNIEDNKKIADNKNTEINISSKYDETEIKDETKNELNLDKELQIKTDEQQEKNDDGVFIKERIPEEKRLKVRKISSLKTSKTTLSPNKENNSNSNISKPFSTEKVDNLYKNSQIDKLNKEELNYKKLKEIYQKNNINFQPFEKNKIETINNSSLKKFILKKSIFFLCLIIIETLALYFISTNLISNILYPSMFVAMPAVFIVGILLNFLNKIKSNKKMKGFKFSLIVFVAGLFVFVGFAILLDIDYNNLLAYSSTLILFLILWLNVLINGIFNHNYIKKSMR